ncbi:MAG: DNA-processing protein DprA [Pseudomonadales bacterium]
MAVTHSPVDQEHRARLYMALQHLPELGPVREARLFKHFSSLEQLLNAGHADWQSARLHADTQAGLLELIRRDPQSSYIRQAEKDFALCEQSQWSVVTQEDEDYPPLLAEINLPPPLLYVWGNKSILKHAQVALVGSRKASKAGLDTAQRFATQLASSGLVVCSGMALGIDSASHKAALNAGQPTVAVLGSGLANLYPRRNQSLAAEIAKNGCVISEFPPATSPQPGNFPQRNRIISGLSHATIVIEAAKRSGSLITARYALEQNREVYAVPGSINNAGSSGCNELIKSGARLLNHPADVLDALQCQLSGQQPAQLEDFEPQQQAVALRLATVLHQIHYEPTAIDAIIQETGLAVAEVSAALLELQLCGRIEQTAGRYQRIR